MNERGYGGEWSEVKQRVMARAELTLTEFLLARIAEDEADAKDGIYALDADLGDKRRRNRILGDCLVKRRIVEMAVDLAQGEAINYDDQAYGRLAALEDIAALLALPHAAHPDYREGWGA